MSYTTLHLVARSLTDAEARAKTNYVLSQIKAGTTDGIETPVFRAGLEHFAQLYPGQLRETRWTTAEAANAYIAWLNANLNPGPIFTQEIEFGAPGLWVDDIVDNSPNQTPV